MDAQKIIKQRYGEQGVMKIFALVHDSVLAEVEEDYIHEYKSILKSCIQKDRGMSIPDCPIGCDFEVGEDYSMGKFAKQYET